MEVDRQLGRSGAGATGVRREPPLRVAYVTMQFPTPTETFAGTDVRVLREAGVDVEVFALRPERPDREELLRQRGLDDLPVVSLTPARYAAGAAMMLTRPRWWTSLMAWTVRHQWRHPKTLARCLVVLPSALALFDRIHARRFDVVHLFWGHYPSMVLHLVQRFRPEVVTSMFLGAYDLMTSRYGVWVPGSAAVARRADAVWTHSRANLERLRSLGIPEANTQCVYRGVDLRAFPLGPAAPSPGRVAGRVVSIGSLIERKGMDDVLRVIAWVRGAVPAAHLRVLGEGPELAELTALARSLGVEDAVTFVGHVSGAEAASELRRASAFVLLSKSDRLPNAAKEAMASGCPCVVSATPGMEELIEHGRTGYLVDVGDLEGASARLADVLSQPDAHAAMVAAAHAHVTARFSAEASMRAYREGWRSAMEARLHRQEVNG